ncbi:cryptochrome/photolyase family protein [Aestuariibacter halophilus]|uniref:Cryptochrome/photolyase family protein n=1 Tax=Fluctibacter halophilus TaxID=226011 RepID=A0ABS8G7K7_9ALTE|nr:cryptochrome/photolyase family protein [Aestuariibacter halophilus]MCC2616574.1 cryptochrome/photolyase family protein [Aestuariibacter halophilus]
MGKTLRLVLGDQLSRDLASLRDADKHHDIILLAEVREEATYVQHHKQKIVLLFSAMRHFANALRDEGFTVIYRHYDDADNQGSLFGEVQRVCEQHPVDAVALTHPGEYRLLQAMQTWQSNLDIPVTIREDDRFLCPLSDFAAWARDRKQLRMEFFYREMRKRWNILMDQQQPVGGKWNYDSANRNPLPENVSVPSPTQFATDDITRDVMALVENHFSDHFGRLDGFHYAVTRAQALTVLDEFIRQRLVHFGDYQDAMATDQPWLFHAHISFYLNCGLLLPKEVIAQVESVYRQGQVPLNAAEGFIRQVLGWREYVRGLYWLKMPDYKQQNYLHAKRALPSFFWDADTDMACLSQCIGQTRDTAYAHHIQRLMVIGNFSLLAGLSPDAVNDWYLRVYADAYEWVELPNVTGMILFADGGVLASKPYAASGAYIHRMSDYCQHCHYNVKQKNGPQACPFNYLYWHFLMRNQHQLSNNPRLGMPYRTLANMDDDKVRHINEDAELFLSRLDQGERV